jgi:hypothetical protein
VMNRKPACCFRTKLKVPSSLSSSPTSFTYLASYVSILEATHIARCSLYGMETTLINPHEFSISNVIK